MTTGRFAFYGLAMALACSACGLGAARAEEPGDAPAASAGNVVAPQAPPPSPPPAAEEVTVLQPLEVTAKREDPLTKELRRHDREAEGEKTAETEHRHGLLSRVFNGWKLPFFNRGFTADRLAEGAARRAEILDLERGLIVAIHQAETKEEKRALKADLAALRDLRRVTVATDKRPSGN